ncbi:MAG: sigma-70 family RNA polymerase sigma factor [Candidatus Eisenbacteria bacterium]|uniref:Sigma-70 family RNA polymerase sigma factor n=1 Tax=Eiseniibacteriota bacterium TaxID=2212470 RepID=A0A956NDH1_UNCEI|nr:sigma-70 family RNA polymerase sigma factor [Candidatus Eisenbacteria bacterium]
MLRDRDVLRYRYLLWDGDVLLRREPRVRLPVNRPGTEPTTEEVWNQLRVRVRNYLRSRVSDPDDAEDLLQEVFLRVHRGLGSLRSEEALDGWVARIVRNVITDHIRARAARRNGANGHGGSPASSEHDADDRDRGTHPTGVDGTFASEIGIVPAEVDEREERRSREQIAACLLPLMSVLPADQREALELTEVRGLTQKEAAELVGLSVPGMKSRVQRAKHRLREVMDACCRLHFDARGNLLDCTSRNCADSASGPPGESGRDSQEHCAPPDFRRSKG